ncbi:hypothetical protein D0T50_05250 [Bacteroides sp. 214]|uniref:hypothetical protein n=1 Tax=Bacteroides sp. 214 TaxID=2302935 RepID=UPI0013D4E517|nr:hypothetical protein [Bacteroides sp. 214]NDW12295.1 hypothetical protein [Bacteroides sp. 214]
MKLKRIKSLMLLPILVLGVVACDDNKKDDYKNTILGKWHLVEQGSINDMETITPNGSYIEFISDATFLFYNAKEDTYLQGQYSIDFSLLVFNNSYYCKCLINNELLKIFEVRGPEYNLSNLVYVYKRSN